MNQSIIISEEVKAHFSSRASLAGIGIKVKRRKLFEPVAEKVKVAQKTVKFSPAEKLQDGFIAIMAGAHGLVEINERLRPDPGLQRAFGRDGCAEQSVVQDTRMPARRETWHKCMPRWRRSIAAIARDIATITPRNGKCWMWI